MIKRKICTADEDSLQPRAADHASSGHEAAGTNDIAALGGLSHHRVQYGGVVVIVGRIHDHERRIARGKSGEHGTMRTAAAVADELNRHGDKRAAILRDCRQSVVILVVVANQHAMLCFHLARDCTQRRNDIGALVVDGDDNVEARARVFGHGFSPLVSTKGRNGLINPRLNTAVSMKLYAGSSTRARPDAT